VDEDIVYDILQNKYKIANKRIVDYVYSLSHVLSTIYMLMEKKRQSKLVTKQLQKAPAKKNI
jgi:uncharacterized membrane protein